MCKNKWVKSPFRLYLIYSSSSRCILKSNCWAFRSDLLLVCHHLILSHFASDPFFIFSFVGGKVALCKFDSFILRIRKYLLCLSVGLSKNMGFKKRLWVDWILFMTFCSRCMFFVAFVFWCAIHLIYLDLHPHSNKPINRMSVFSAVLAAWTKKCDSFNTTLHWE